MGQGGLSQQIRSKMTMRYVGRRSGCNAAHHAPQVALLQHNVVTDQLEYCASWVHPHGVWHLAPSPHVQDLLLTIHDGGAHNVRAHHAPFSHSRTNVGGITQAELWQLNAGAPLTSLHVMHTASPPICAAWDPLAPSTLAIGSAEGAVASMAVDAAHGQVL